LTLSVLRNEDTSLLFGRVRKEAEGETKRGRDLANLHIDRARDDLIVRYHHHLVESEMVMRTLIATSGVLPTVVVHMVVLLLLGDFRMDIALPIVRDYFLDEALLRVEIVTDGVAHELLIALLEYRSANWIAYRIS